MYRGSRKHVLDWVERDRFPVELLALAAPAPVKLVAGSRWLPRGYRLPDEAELHWFGPAALPSLTVWPSLHSWWLKHKRNATTPNWDIAMACEVDGRPGLILVEAKAHEAELERGAKRPDRAASAHSKENHEHIAQAIAGARRGYATLGHDVLIGVESHYQLSNRLAYAWKLAQMGVPTVLIYLGFVGDRPWDDGLVPFKDQSHWDKCVRAYFDEIGAGQLLGCVLTVAEVPVWFFARSRPVRDHSPRAGQAG